MICKNCNYQNFPPNSICTCDCHAVAGTETTRNEESSTEHASLLSDLKKKLEGMKQSYRAADKTGSSAGWGDTSGYNRAIQDAINLLNTYEEN